MSRTLTLTKDDVHRGYLILVNHDFPIKEQSYREKLVTFNIDFNYVQLNYRLREHLIDLFHELKSNTKIIPTSGYRSLEEQTKLYENSLIENGKAFTEAYVALPNHSEHQTGLAIDLAINEDNIDLIRPSFPNYGISGRFKKLCFEYGFIERYTKCKETITHINAEEWHFRYVGYPHSKIMSNLNLCLEQYHDYIKEYKYKENPFIFENYEISYLAYEENISVTLNDYEEYSGNNIDGFIFTRYIQ